MNNYEKAGLIPVGKNDEGEQMYMGTQEQWDKLEEEEEEVYLELTQSKINLIDHCLGYCKHRLEKHHEETNGLSQSQLDPIISLRKELKQ